MSLALAFETTIDTVPRKIPYLTLLPEKQNEWHARLGAKVKPRIGLTWSTSGKLVSKCRWIKDVTREIPLSELQRIIKPGVDYFCLQKHIHPADDVLLKAIPEITTYRDLLDDFSDTAALASEMDLVISVDTSVAHLAGALGKPLFVLLPTNPRGFWSIVGRQDCPWYPAARLFMQEQPGDWDGVISRVIKELENVPFAI
jgi:hypothetical protein